MTDKLFDDFVQSKLEHYDSGAPMHVWDRIKKEKDDRKGFFFFRNRYWLLAAALLITTGGGFLIADSFSKKENKLSLASVSDKPVEQQTNNKASIEKNIQLIKASVSKEPETEKETKGLGNNLNSAKSKSDFETKKTTAVFVPGNNVQLNRSKRNIVKTKSEIKNFPEENTAGFIKNSGQNSNGSLSVNQKSTINAGNAASKMPTELEFSNRSNFLSAPLQNFGLSSAVLQNQIRPACPTITGPRRNDLYLEFYVSPDYAVRSFQKADILPNYIALRKNTEDSRTGFSTGFRIVKNTGEKTLLKTGVNYTQINERLRLIDQNQKQITQIITIRTIINSPGDTLFIRDTTYYEQTGSTYRTSFNRYRFIDIPVLFSYEFGNPEIMSFAITAGPVFNITSFYKGEVLDTSLKPVRISTAAGKGVQNWRSNIGMGFFASFAVFKRINERMQIFGEPYLRYNFNPVTQNNTIVQQRYATTGMQLGIRYNLKAGRHRSRQ
jgi:hypothetical protein